MKNIATNKIIIYITIFISLFLSVRFLPTFETFNSIWNFLIGILIIIFMILMPVILGFIFALPFILFAKKINSEKILMYIFCMIFFLILLFFVYHLYYYTNEIKMFEFEQRLRSLANDITNPFIKFFLLTLQSCFEANIQFVNLMAGFMISIYRKL